MIIIRPGKLASLTALVAVILATTASAAVDQAEIGRRLDQMPKEHPRLFLAAGGEEALRKQVAADPIAKKVYAAIMAEAERQLATKPVERVLIGRRLLDKSRTCLSRVLHLGMAWRLTGDRKYLERVRAELVAASGFSDWNPKHFLDVAEMTMAVGVGYDWFHGALDEPTRQLLRDAIVEKGLQASLQSKSNSWTRSVNNWNQVCNAGMAVGALAVAKSEPALAAQIVARSINTVPVSMHEYVPDGAYPEGPSYWGYGTTFNVLLISALQSTLGSDFGLTQQPGFLATADYYLHVAGPSGYYFNYADCGRGGQGVAPAMFWFAAQRQEPHLLWSERQKLDATERPSRGRDRTSPLMLLWVTQAPAGSTPPPQLSWTGHGSNPVAFHRSAWDRHASFVALKGGSPSTNHAHMDVGAFVMDADGVRWADDLGSQDYNSLESKGIDLWGRKQESGRWKVFRLGTSAHNVLMVDGQQQRVDGKAPITIAKTGRTVVDTSSIYHGQLAQARRGVVLQPDRTVRVQDEFTTLDKVAGIRWAMVTLADVRIAGPGRATLTQQGKQLNFRVLEPANATLKVYPTDPPPAPTDARNPGTRMIGFEVSVPAGQSQRLVVQLEPASARPANAPVQPLPEW